MKKIIYFVMIFVTFVSEVSISQVTQEWVARYNGPGTGSDYATLKYNSLDIQDWLVRNNGAVAYNGARIIAVDDIGNDYFTGLSEGINFDYASLKYSQQSQSNLTTGLIAYYPFNENADDYSGNNYHGTFQNNSYITSGIIGNGVQITGDGFVNGNGGFVLLPTQLNDELRNLNEFSISLWIKEEYMTHFHGSNYINFGDHNYGMLGIGHLYFEPNSTQNIDFFSGVLSNNPRIQFPFNENLSNRFILYTMTYSNGNLKSYINGFCVSQIFQPILIYGSNAALGKHWWDGGNVWATRLQGIIDDVRIYDRVLSDTEILQLHQMGASIFLSSPNGNENFSGGQQTNISWNNIAVDTIKLELSTDNGNTWSTINPKYPAYSGYYSWIVQNTPSSQCKIKISDANDSNVFDESDNVFTISQTTLSSDMIAYYPFTGDASDESGNGNHGTNYGATLTQDMNGNNNRAFYFDGIDDYINIPDFSLLNLNSITFHAVIYPYNLNETVFVFHGNTGNVALTTIDNKIGFWLALSNGQGYLCEANAIPNRWYNVTATWERGHKMKLYLDGQLASEILVPDAGFASDPYHSSSIGAFSRFWYPTEARPFNGKIDEVRFYNRALSEIEIQQIGNQINPITVSAPNAFENLLINSNYQIQWSNFSGEPVGIEYTTNNGVSWNLIANNIPSNVTNYNWTVPNKPSSHCKVRIRSILDSTIFSMNQGNFTIYSINTDINLIAYYPFTGNTSDESGNGNHGTNFGATLTSDLNNAPNSAYYFNGTDNFISIPDFDLLNLNAVTVHCEFFPTRNTPMIAVYHAKNGEIQIQTQNDQVAFNVKLSDNVWYQCFANIESNNWYKITGIWEKNIAIKLFLNGQLISQLPVPNFDLHNPYTHHSSIGVYNAGEQQFFNGKIDEVRFYNRALSDIEVQQLYNQATPITISSPTDGNNLIASSTKYIQWNAISGISNVKIEYSTNGGANWNTISLSYPASYNSYLWTVPNVSSNQCKVRVSNISNASVNAVSGVFSITQSTSMLLNFKLKGQTSSVKKFMIKSDKDKLVKNVLSNEISFSYQEISNLATDKDKVSADPGNYKIKKIIFLNQTNDTIGKIYFKYKLEDFNENNNSGKKVDAVLYIDDITAFDVDFLNNPGWKYFSNQNEHLVYMLIPPYERFDSVKYFKKPTLFVHGIYGKYPTWGNNPFNLNNNLNGWQLYYPYDMRIPDCSYILKKAIDNILSGNAIGSGSYGSQNMNIIAHSMGGLVSRFYIQNNTNQKANKLLMLGTPNNGSLASYRTRKNELFTGNLSDFINKDQYSPAHIDMSPASNFLYGLKHSSIKAIGSRPINKSYLIIAGTNNNIRILSTIHHEAEDQEDGVVSVSSASMLDSLVPLATKHLNHLELPAGISPMVINAFLDETYDPTSTPEENVPLGIIVDNTNGFYTTRTNVKKEDTNFDKKQSILYFTIFGADNNSDVKFSNESQNIYTLDFGKSHFNSMYLRSNPEDTKSYFVRDKGVLDQIGLILNTVQSTIKIKFRKFISNDYITIPNISGSFPYNSIQTKWIQINLSRDIRHLANANTYLNSTAGVSSSSKNNFYIDNSIDTISFCLSGNPDDTAFINNNFKLTDPNNIVIDSIYASQHSNIIYKQSLEDALVYYYIENPVPGNYTAQFNSNISEPFLVAPIQSPVTVDLRFADSVYAAGDTVKFTSTWPSGVNINSIQFNAKLSFIKRGTTNVLDLGNVSMKKASTYSFGGQFFARGAGEYRIDLSLNCNYNNQSIERRISNSINLNLLRAPSTLFPKNDSLSVPQSVKFIWNKNIISNNFELALYKTGDTIPTYNFSNITDTSYNIDSLQRETNYFWQVRSIVNIDTSEWSVPKFFTTIINPPDTTSLENPPNNSGGLYSPLTLNWRRSVKADTYHCQVSSDSLFGNLIYNESNIADTMVTLDSLNYPVKYFWRVRAVNSGGSSEFTDHWSFNTIQPVSQTFINVTISPQGFYNESSNSLGIADTIKCYLMNNQSPFNIVDSSSALLDSVSLMASFEFMNFQTGIYYLRIKHRNSIETWSKNGGDVFTRFGTSFYDFTSSQSQAYGSNMIEIGNRWFIFSGDVNQDGNVDLTDIVLINNNTSTFMTGYFATDLNGDNLTDLTDLILANNNAARFVSVIRP